MNSIKLKNVPLETLYKLGPNFNPLKSKNIPITDCEMTFHEDGSVIITELSKGNKITLAGDDLIENSEILHELLGYNFSQTVSSRLKNILHIKVDNIFRYIKPDQHTKLIYCGDNHVLGIFTVERELKVWNWLSDKQKSDEISALKSYDNSLEATQQLRDYLSS